MLERSKKEAQKRAEAARISKQANNTRTGPFLNMFKVESLKYAGMSKELKALTSIPSDAIMELDQ